VITVKQLREALAHFPDDAKCYAYEGLSFTSEPTGVVICKDEAYGVIHCSESDREETEVQYFPGMEPPPPEPPPGEPMVIRQATKGDSNGG
jgi:hypothetical protein